MQFIGYIKHCQRTFHPYYKIV